MVQLVVARAALLLLITLSLAGCDTQCRQACQHLLDDCGVDRADYGVDDCSSQCQAFVAHYEDQWQEQQARDAVLCTRDAECADLRAGAACYDEAVYIW